MTARQLQDPLEPTDGAGRGAPVEDAGQNVVEEGGEDAAHTGLPDDLHNLFASTPNFKGTDEEDPLAALRTDPNYSALIRDLEYIASQARLLFAPAEEAPSEEVWKKIERELGNVPPKN